MVTLDVRLNNSDSVMSFNLIPELPQTHYHVVYVTSCTEYSTYVVILPHFLVVLVVTVMSGMMCSQSLLQNKLQQGIQDPDVNQSSCISLVLWVVFIT